MQRVYRLTNRASFSYIYRKGKRVSAKYISLCYIEARNLKVGISVSKKIGNSVARSLVKRRIKEYFRKIIPLLKQEYNYIFVAKEGIADKSYDEIGSSITALLKKSKLFYNSNNEENL